MNYTNAEMLQTADNAFISILHVLCINVVTSSSEKPGHNYQKYYGSNLYSYKRIDQ